MRRSLKPFQKEQWVIPPKASASFVYNMERVLAVYERPYDKLYPVVCMDESPKQIIDYKEFIDSTGKKRKDSEYIRLGVAEIFVAFEPLAGFREMTVENDHKTDTWVLFIALMMDTVYKMATKVTAAADRLGNGQF